MEQLLEKAFASIHRGQFSAAKNYLQEIIKNSNSENPEKIYEAYLALMDIQKHEKKSGELQKTITEYLKFLYQNKKFEEILTKISELELDQSKNLIYFQIKIKEIKIKAHEALGHFQKSQNETENYLKKLIEIKQYDQAEGYLEGIIKKFPYQFEWQLFLVKVLIGKYQFDKAMDNLEFIINQSEIHNKAHWFNEYVELLSEMNDESKLANDYFEILNSDTLKGKDQFTKLLNVLINRHSFNFIFFISWKFVNSARFSLAKSFASYLEKNFKKLIKKNERSFTKMKEMIASKRKEVIILPTEATREDLTELKLEKLKNDLVFLRVYDTKERYQRCLKKIMKIDPFFTEESELVEVNQVQTKTSKLAKKDKQVSSDEIFRNLLSEISYYSTSSKKDENVLLTLERELTKSIELYQDEILTSNYNDYILMLYSFKLYESALLLVSKVKEKLDTDPKNIKSYLEVSYMEVTLKNELGKDYDSLEILNFILTQLPLSLDEKICFLYMAGECYFHLGQGREAIKYYRKILKLTDSYRLTKARVEFLEKA